MNSLCFLCIMLLNGFLGIVDFGGGVKVVVGVGVVDLVIDVGFVGVVGVEVGLVGLVLLVGDEGW